MRASNFKTLQSVNQSIFVVECTWFMVNIVISTKKASFFGAISSNVLLSSKDKIKLNVKKSLIAVNCQKY